MTTQTEQHPPVPTGTISLKLRWTLWLIAWGVAALATVVPVFGLLLFFWLFPAGLFALFGGGDGGNDGGSPAVGYTLLIGGWVLYVVLSVYCLKQRERARYFWVYGVLVALLALNAAGCRYEMAHMHFGC